MIIDRENYYNKRIPFLRRLMLLGKITGMVIIRMTIVKGKEKFPGAGYR